MADARRAAGPPAPGAGEGGRRGTASGSRARPPLRAAPARRDPRVVKGRRTLWLQPACFVPGVHLGAAERHEPAGPGSARALPLPALLQRARRPAGRGDTGPAAAPRAPSPALPHGGGPCRCTTCTFSGAAPRRRPLPLHHVHLLRRCPTEEAPAAAPRAPSPALPHGGGPCRCTTCTFSGAAPWRRPLPLHHVHLLRRRSVEEAPAAAPRAPSPAPLCRGGPCRCRPARASPCRGSLSGLSPCKCSPDKRCNLLSAHCESGTTLRLFRVIKFSTARL
ncbi:translation initiation factor IF-2-like [Myotis myotis]|uniref:translation initiation factor IF-2-like n=1 Tax=Myotis myotis TaxID=51298 RepID=UPI00174D31A5|nr:translation initiation factor IF-2-like [Myotis myotis]